nr:SDR family oxidoreductase [Actinomadura rubrisoli]
MWAKRGVRVPMGHMGTPWDVAETALFLAGDRSKYVTGIELVVDGEPRSASHRGCSEASGLAVRRNGGGRGPGHVPGPWRRHDLLSRASSPAVAPSSASSRAAAGSSIRRSGSRRCRRPSCP